MTEIIPNARGGEGSSKLRSWFIHRAAIVNLAWPLGVAEAACIEPNRLDAILADAKLEYIGRSARSYLARAMKISVRDLEALCGGRIDWIPDGRKVDFDRLSPVIAPLPATKYEAYICRAGFGIPILGRILETGVVEHFDDWTSEDGPRLSVRYAGLPDAFALELTVGIGSWFAGECLVFMAIVPGEIRGGEITLLCRDSSEGQSELCVVERAAESLSCTIRPVAGSQLPRMIALADILRAARIVGSWKR
ncbi:MAG TPA: hypothetical protein VFE47_20135 [Tepidisphaeraceae bacterium]|nr:hypothetical protein [Tepidisphaeraceae bacterium]